MRRKISSLFKIDAIFEIILFYFPMLKNYHQQIYFASLLLLVFSLPLSMFLLSTAQIILLLNWLLENNFTEKWELAKKKKSILAFTIIYGVHIVGMVYSSDWQYGLHDLKIKLPLLILPILIGTSKPLSPNYFKLVLIGFCSAVFISTLISTGILFGFWGKPVMDVRDISIFISHIRLSLMINLAIFILAWFITHTSSLRQTIILVIAVLWFIFFLIILKSLTGIIILLALVVYFGLKWILKTQNFMAKWFVIVGSLSLFLIITTFISHSIAKFSFSDKLPAHLEESTVNGNFYSHNIHSKDTENGHYTWIYVCDKELELVWNKRSTLNYKGTDLKSQELRYTIIRYLTSKDLKKDSAGLMTLEDKDIRNIEQGMANYIYSWKFSLYPRIYQLLWEVKNYKEGANPSGHSFTQRLEYLKTAKHIIQSNFWFGVGTGDVAHTFDQQYTKDNSKLIPRWRLRAHNQLLTFWITFGLVGLIIISGSLIYPVLKEMPRNNYFIILFLIIGFLSFLNEDTLETHAGLSFFAFFYAFFLYNSLSDNGK